MAKIRKYALGGVAGVSAPATTQASTSPTGAPSWVNSALNTTPQNLLPPTATPPTGSGTLSNMTPMSPDQVAAFKEMGDQMRTRVAPMGGGAQSQFSGFANTTNPNLPSWAGSGISPGPMPMGGPQGGPLARPGMGGQFGPMGGPMGRFGGNRFGPMGRPGMPTGRGGGINPTSRIPKFPVRLKALPSRPPAQRGEDGASS